MLEDRQIIELYWQKNADAISETASKYGAYCFTIAENILHNTEDSEECVNDTWLHAWTNDNGGEDISPSPLCFMRI